MDFNFYYVLCSFSLLCFCFPISPCVCASMFPPFHVCVCAFIAVSGDGRGGEDGFFERGGCWFVKVEGLRGFWFFGIQEVEEEDGRWVVR